VNASEPFNPSDDELIEQVQAHQSCAFDILFERYAQPVRHHLLRLAPDAAAAEDLLQETFLRVWTRAEQWNGLGLFKGWLFRIATNLALNYLRSQKRRPEQPLEIPEDPYAEDDAPETPAWLVDTASLGPDEALDAAERRSQLRQMLDDLPQEQRDVFRLVHQFDLSLRDAADELGIPSGTVKSRLHYARQRLTQSWQAWQAEEE
jgi:RNA polymerase sigma-70 factor (ECF subfamily)